MTPLTSRTPGVLVGGGLGLLGALAAVNRALRLDDLPSTLPGAYHDWPWRGWRVRYTTLGAGPPLVLVHGIHAAASSYEMRGIFEPLAARHTVYAVDWLGFGKSERPAIAYTAALYADLLGDLLREVVRAPAVVVASSLSTAYAVNVAARWPEAVSRLVLLSPTFQTRPGSGRRVAGHLLRLPLVGTAAFNGLVSRASIRRYLARVYADPDHVDEQIVGQAWATSHQPGARHAPAAFVAGALDLPPRPGGGQIAAPILVVRGSTGGIGEQASDAGLRGLGAAVMFEAVEGVGHLPHDEAPDRVAALVEAWLTSDGRPPGA